METTTTQLTAEETKAVERFRKQREYHRNYYLNNKSKVLAYHAERRKKDAAIVRSLKSQGFNI